MQRKTRICIKFMMPDGKYDECNIKMDDEEQSVHFTHPHQHKQWLKRYEVFDSQYQLFAIPLREDEYEKTNQFLVELRMHEPLVIADDACIASVKGLTTMQCRMIILMSEGRSNREIAIELNIKLFAVIQQFKRWRDKYNINKSLFVALEMIALYKLR